MTEPTTDVVEIAAQAIANVGGSGGGIPAGQYQRDLANAVLDAFGAAGIEVLRPEDIEWGTCPDHLDGQGEDGETHGPHRVALNMCVYCLQFDPD